MNWPWANRFGTNVLSSADLRTWYAESPGPQSESALNAAGERAEVMRLIERTANAMELAGRREARQAMWDAEVARLKALHRSGGSFNTPRTGRGRGGELTTYRNPFRHPQHRTYAPNVAR